MNLQNKVVWITGASSGIGEALAYQFAKEGAKLVLSARRMEELDRVKKSLNLPNDSVLNIPIDMLKPEEFAAKTQAVLAHFGQIDAFVPNAGVSQREQFLDVAPADFKKLMDTNFTNVVLLTREVLPHLLAHPESGILVTSSVSGKIGTAYRTFYCASKHAIQGFFDSLRGEVWRNGVQVTVACPGYIKTNISINAIAKDGKPFGKMDQNQAKGIPAEVCAQKMVAAFKAGKHEVVIAGFMETLGTYLKRFAPAILWQFTKNYNIKAVEE
ncbi:MAG: SDR family oxidoreductase [Spirosomataceae bacterium]